MSLGFTNAEGRVRNGFKVVGFAVALWASWPLVGLAVVSVGFFTGTYSLHLPPFIEDWPGVVFALAASWLCLKMEGEPLGSIGLRMGRRFMAESLLGAAVGVALILVTSLAVMAPGGFTWVRNAQVGASDILVALSGFMARGAFEELLFRGYAFQRTIRGMGEVPALLLFCLLFAAAHLANPGMDGDAMPLACLNIGIASLMLGLAYTKTGSLALPIGIHLGWNWAQGPLLGFGVSGNAQQGYWTPVPGDLPRWLTGGEFGLEASLPCTLVCAAACLCLALWGRRLNEWKWLGYNPQELG